MAPIKRLVGNTRDINDPNAEIEASWVFPEGTVVTDLTDGNLELERFTIQQGSTFAQLRGNYLMPFTGGTAREIRTTGFVQLLREAAGRGFSPDYSITLITDNPSGTAPGYILEGDSEVIPLSGPIRIRSFDDIIIGEDGNIPPFLDEEDIGLQLIGRSYQGQTIRAITNPSVTISRYIWTLNGVVSAVTAPMFTIPLNANIRPGSTLELTVEFTDARNEPAQESVSLPLQIRTQGIRSNQGYGKRSQAQVGKRVDPFNSYHMPTR